MPALRARAWSAWGAARQRVPLRWRNHLVAYLLVAPSLAFLILYVFIPVGYTFYISIQDLHLGNVPYVGPASGTGGYVNPNAHTSQTFFGFRNWYNLFHHDAVFDMAVRNTIVMVGGATLLGVLGALIAALVVTQRVPFIGVFRTAFFLPAAISQVVTGLVFLWLFDENFGLVNHVLGFVGLGPYLWQDDARYLLLALTLAAAWITASYSLPVFAAALQNVPQSQQEAATLDGAGRAGVFWHVTMPTLRPATWFVMISSTVAVSQMLGLYDALGQDTVESSTLVKYMFARAFYYNDIDYAGAIGCVLIVLLTTAALLQLWVLDRGAEQ